MDRNTVVGEFELSFLRGDKVRIGDDPRWRPMGDFLYNHGSSFSAARSFIGDNNVEYRWKVRQGTLMLCKGGSGAPALITFHRDRYNPNDASYLEVHDIETLESLEKVIVSFLIMERRTGQA
ncbi:hypothetical protein FRC16_003996 [Serendipita sp. 398]|nr:hypothetical protein FRC16_003996 [Serendipita sp. 398]